MGVWGRGGEGEEIGDRRDNAYIASSPAGWLKPYLLIHLEIVLY